MHRDIFRLAYSAKMSADNTDTAEMMLYGEIIPDTPDAWKWSKEDKSAADFNKAVNELKAKGATKLLLRINSPGGVCTEAVAMRSILANAGFEEINIRIEGLCASAATDIATLPGAHVSIAEGSEYMIHNPWCVAFGNANEMEHTIERLRNIEDMSRGFYMKRTGLPEEQIREWMDAETWFTAKQAVLYGFADDLLETEMPAACASSREMAVMRGIYKSVPEQIKEQAEEVSNGTPNAGEPSEKYTSKEDDLMELKDLTLDQLRDGNPALLAQIQQDAVQAERERLSDIDALTMPGYEEIAEKAKADGMSVLDFQKQVVAAMKQKAADFMQARKEETAPAQEVVGDAPQAKTEEQDIKDAAQAVAEYAKSYNGIGADGMY